MKSTQAEIREICGLQQHLMFLRVTLAASRSLTLSIATGLERWTPSPVTLPKNESGSRRQLLDSGPPFTDQDSYGITNSFRNTPRKGSGSMSSPSIFMEADSET